MTKLLHPVAVISISSHFDIQRMHHRRTMIGAIFPSPHDIGDIIITFGDIFIDVMPSVPLHLLPFEWAKFHQVKYDRSSYYYTYPVHATALRSLRHYSRLTALRGA